MKKIMLMLFTIIFYNNIMGMELLTEISWVQIMPPVVAYRAGMVVAGVVARHYTATSDNSPVDSDTSAKINKYALHNAAFANDVVQIKLLLQEGAPINLPGIDSKTPLHCSVQAEHKEATEFLLHNGAYLNAQDSEGETVLHYAARSGNIPLLALLIETGSTHKKILPSEALVKTGVEAIQTAVKMVHNAPDSSYYDKAQASLVQVTAQSVPYLMPCAEMACQKAKERGYSFPSSASRFTETLANRCCQENADIVDHKEYSDLDMLDKKGNTPLFYAVENGHKEAVEFLIIKHGALVNRAGDYAKTPLHCAVENGHEEIARMLLEETALIERGIAANATYKWFIENASTALNMVDGVLVAQAATGIIRAIAAYCSTGASECVPWNLIPCDGLPTELAKSYVLDPLREKLSEKQAAITYALGMTPLHYAAMKGNDAIVSLLLIYDAPVNVRGFAGRTPLHYAAKHGHAKVAQTLLEQGACVDSPCARGMTPLHCAASYKHIALICLLMRAGAHIDAVDYNGESVLHNAVETGHIVTIKTVLGYNASINSATKKGHTPLFHAILKGDLNTVKLLLDHNADVNLTDAQHKTPLHYCAQSGSEPLTQLLLEHGAHVSKHVPDVNLQTPLNIATQLGHEQLRPLLRDMRKEQKLIPKISYC